MAQENMQVDLDELIKLETINDNCSALKIIFTDIVHHHPPILDKLSTYIYTDEQDILSNRQAISLNFIGLYLNYITSTEHNNRRNFRSLLSPVVFDSLESITQYNIYRLTKSLNNPQVLTFAFEEASRICLEDRTKQTFDDDMLSDLLQATNLDNTAASTYLDSLASRLSELRLR